VQSHHVFTARSNIAADGMCHQYLHIPTGGCGTRLHTGWNVGTGAGFCSLTDRDAKVVEPTRFTTDGWTMIGEWQTWTSDAGTYAQLGVATATSSIVWSAPVSVSTFARSRDCTVELPGLEGIIAFVPNVTAAYSTWAHVMLPHSMTTTSGPGLMLIAWNRTFELCGQIIERPNSPPHIAGLERFKGKQTSAIGPWIPRPQVIYGQLANPQLSAAH
jgi:hypothetical protein